MLWLPFSWLSFTMSCNSSTWYTCCYEMGQGTMSPMPSLSNSFYNTSTPLSILCCTPNCPFVGSLKFRRTPRQKSLMLVSVTSHSKHLTSRYILEWNLREWWVSWGTYQNLSLYRVMQMSWMPLMTSSSKGRIKWKLQLKVAILSNTLPYLLFVGLYFISVNYGPFTPPQLGVCTHKPSDSAGYEEGFNAAGGPLCPSVLGRSDGVTLGSSELAWVWVLQVTTWDMVQSRVSSVSKAVHEWFVNHENFGKNAIVQYLAVQIKICKIYWKMHLLLRYLLLCYVRKFLSLYKP